MEVNVLPVASPVSAGRSCVFCNHHIDAWGVFGDGIVAPSLFTQRLHTIGSSGERFWCTNCKSIDRERHLYLFFERLNLWEAMHGATILHIAPEYRLGEVIRASDPSLYVAGDLCPENESIQQMNLERLTFPDQVFDIVICNHVLEHVTALTAALAEIRRVLKPGGRFICQTPYATRLTNTFEENLLKTKDDRAFFYGQDDHVRLFGLDIVRIIIEAGFIGRLVRHDEILPEVDPELLGVNEKEPFFDFVRG